MQAMDYNSGNEGVNRGMPMNQGMPQGQGMPPKQGMPMNQGMPPRQGMPMNQGMPPGQGMPPRQGMPMNQGMPPGQGMPPRQGMPMNQGMPPRQGMPMNQGMPPGQGMPPRQGMTMNRDMSSGRGMPYRGSAEGSDKPLEPKPRMRSMNPLPPENDEGSPRSRGSRLFDGDDDGNRVRSGRPGIGLGNVIPQGFIEGLTNVSGIVYGAILCICLLIALIAYGTTHKASGKSYNIPTDMLTYNGLFRDIYENAITGGLNNKPAAPMYDEDGTEIPAAPTAIGEETAPGMGSQNTTASDTQGAGTAAEGTESTTSGAAMVVDSGSGSDGYKQAESYKELLTQLETAIASGDTAFVGTKLAYEDENGNLKGYPQSVVDHFVTYMSTNSDKRTALMTELGNDKYSAQNGSAFIVKLPYIKFVVNMGYDNTTISLPGFSDQVVNAGQSADIAPLLPCMYTLTINNPEWSEVVTRDIEANVNESTISINIKP